MNAEQMSRAIADALQHEAQTFHLANELHKLARTRGLRPRPQEIAGTIEFLRQYVAHVPVILQEAERAAQAAGLRGEMAALIATVEQYWFESDDFFPDHQGLGGLVDDAYVALSVIQGASARFRQRTGRPLIDLDMSVANASVRLFIGEPFATQLDVIVANAVQRPAIQTSINQMMTRVAAFPLNTPDPIWGNASVDDIVRVRMGAIGIL